MNVSQLLDLSGYDAEKLYLNTIFDIDYILTQHHVKYDNVEQKWYVDWDYNVGNLQHLMKFGYVTDCYIYINNHTRRITLPEPELCPDGYLSAYQWMKKHHKVPLSENVLETYVRLDKEGMPLQDDQGNYITYQYISPNRVIDASEEQIKEFEQKEALKKEQCAQISKKKKHDTQTSKTPKPSKTTLTQNRHMVDFSKFVESALRNTPKQAIFNPTNVVCFDTETTGFAKDDELLQITLVDGNNKILFDSFVKPYCKQIWTEAMNVNGITPKMVENSPYPHEIAPIIRDIFEDADLIIGHNILKFDIDVVERILQIDLSQKEKFDTLTKFKLDKPGKSGHKLGDAVEYYCPEFLETYKNGAHKSDIDTLCTLEVYKKQIEKEKNIEINEEIEIDFD